MKKFSAFKNASVLIAAAVSLPLFISTLSASANTLLVPGDFPTIQAAVDAASPEDQIRVGPGEWCGATITKTLDLFGEGGATIVGCDLISDLGGVLHIGFFLPDGSASGSSFRHFLFDGAGVSNQGDGNFDPLSFAIFARDTDDIITEQNHVIGTVQGFTNTRGSGWTVNHNIIEDLTVFTCDGVLTCGGGDGIVFQDRDLDVPRQADNTAMFNDISGTVPDSLALFDMAGILVLGAEDGTVIQKNRIAIPDNPNADGQGHAIRLANTCCGSPALLQTVTNAVVVKNDGRNSEFSVVVDTGNTDGLRLRGNFGVNSINGSDSTVSNRSIHTLVEFP